MAKNEIRVEVTNLKAFNQLIERLERNLPAVAEDVVTKATMQIERDAKIKCPVDTGRLRDSIHSEVESDSDGSTGSVGTNVEYAPYVELGTSKQPAQPYLKPAMDENKDAIVGYAKAKLREVVKG